MNTSIVKAAYAPTDSSIELRSDSKAFEPSSISEAECIAKTLFASRILPKTLATPEAVFAVIVTGREFGLTCMQSVRMLHCIDGKVALSADLAVGLVKRSASCESFELVSSSATEASYTTTRRGEKPTPMSFSITDAQTAGLTAREPWKKYPAAMLRARCAMALARAVYPDVVGGLYDHDELETFVLPTPARTSIQETPAVQVSVAPTQGAAAVSIDDKASAVHSFIERMTAAATVQELSRVGVAISKSKLSTGDKASLREAYNGRRTQLTKPSEQLDVPEDDAREIEAEVMHSQYDE